MKNQYLVDTYLESNKMSIDKYKQYLEDGADGMDDFPRYKNGFKTVPIDPEENKKELDQIKGFMDDLESLTNSKSDENSKAIFCGIVFVIFKYPKNCMEILED